MFICVGNAENFSFAKSVGMGLVDSAMGLTRLILHHAPSEIIFIASAGSYDFYPLNKTDCKNIESKIHKDSIESKKDSKQDSKRDSKRDSKTTPDSKLDSKTTLESKESLNIGDIFYSTHATQLELSFLQSLSYTPIDNSVFIESCQEYNQQNVSQETSQNLKIDSKMINPNVSHETILKPNAIEKLKKTHIPHVIVNSSNYITNTHKFNNAFLKAGIKAENMEFFAILNVAKYFNLPCVGLFCVSNFVCENAHSQFLQNHALTKQKLSNFIRENFDIESRF